MSEFKQSELIKEALKGAKEIVDCNTVLGEPILTESGTTIIPVTKVAMGLATGGLDYYGKHQPATQNSSLPTFGGGGGTGLTVTPIGFLIVKASGDVELLTVDAASSKPTAVSIVEAAIDLVERSPELIEKLKNTFQKKKDGKTPETEESLNSEEEKETSPSETEA